jgi:hypothetical protein
MIKFEIYMITCDLMKKTNEKIKFYYYEYIKVQNIGNTLE